ncbi:Hypoxia up-regulated protein 1 [Mortierella sp. NVP41]|nr:Hypoxia up-regulated protein 1 [Mortierella sp. NVP41]
MAATLGGHEFDVGAQKLLAAKFQEANGSKTSSPVIENERAMFKLLKEANRVEQILSASTETMASIENLMGDIDIKVKVTHAELEDLSKDLLELVRGPIDAALTEGREAIMTMETDSSKKASLTDKVESFLGGSEKNKNVREAEPKDTDEEQEASEAAQRAGEVCRGVCYYWRADDDE